MTNKVAFNPQDRFLITMGNTFMVTTQNGDTFGLDLAGTHIGEAFKFTGAKAAFNPQDRFVVTMGNMLIVTTQNGDVFGHDVSGRNISPAFKFTGAKAAFNPQDRFVVTMGNMLIVTTQNGDAFGHHVSGRDIGVPSLLNPSAHLALDLAANPRHLQINPELVITGRGFTSNGRFHYTIHNWPKIQDIHNQGALDLNGSFSRTESRGFASIGFGIDVPDIEVTAVDEGTGSSITASVSAEKFIARHG
jgi:hypothetical protein